MPTDRKNSPSRIVTVRCIGQHDPGDERAERRRKADKFHQGGRGDDGEKTGHDKHLALTQSADEAEQGAQEETACKHQTDDRANRLQREDPTSRPCFIAPCRRQRGDDGN